MHIEQYLLHMLRACHDSIAFHAYVCIVCAYSACSNEGFYKHQRLPKVSKGSFRAMFPMLFYTVQSPGPLMPTQNSPEDFIFRLSLNSC